MHALRTIFAPIHCNDLQTLKCFVLYYVIVLHIIIVTMQPPLCVTEYTYMYVWVCHNYTPIIMVLDI